MELSKSNLSGIGAVCLFVNGLIFIFYAIAVPAFIQHGVHGLITLAAVLFIVALPAIYHYLGRVHKGAAKAVTALFGLGMLLIVISDVLFMSSAFPRLTHDSIYAFGDALFVICLFAIGLLAWKGGFPKWLAILSILAGIIGVITYAPGAYLLLGNLPSLLLVGVWSLAMGFILRRTK
jgi:hypothetical protein